METLEEAREVRSAALRQLAFVATRLAEDDAALGPGAWLPAHDTLSRALTAFHCAEHRLGVAAQMAGVRPREAVPALTPTLSRPAGEGAQAA